MILLIDAGNTRIKWALMQGKDWLRSGVLPVAQAGELSRHLAGHCDPSTGPGQALPGNGLHDIEQVWVSNVAGEEVARHIRNIGVNRNAKLHFVVARKEQCGVRNGYTQAGQLGSDRWAALLGAWHLMSEECLVVNCGTATTIDALSGQGEFTGGLILPGLDLMQSSLSTATARLIPGKGKYVPFPKNTADAMFTGAIQASCGAIQRQHALLDNDSAPVVMSGGAAGVLREHLRHVTDKTTSHSTRRANNTRQAAGYGEASRLREEVPGGHSRTRGPCPTVSWPHIRMPLRVVDDLILQGLLIIAQEASEA